MNNQHLKEDIRLLNITKSLERICNKLIDKGVSKSELEELSERAGYGGIPRSIGYRAGQVMGGFVFLSFGALGVYLGNKINDSSLIPEVFGGILGFAFGLAGINASEGENTPLITSLIKNYPDKLKQIYSEDGFSEKEINSIFQRDRTSEINQILYS